MFDSFINGLPLPLDATRARVKTDQDLQNGSEAPLLLPGLKAFMQHATGDAKPITMDRFPLAAGPQYVPNPVEDGAGIGGWSPTSWLSRNFGQEQLDLAP